MQPPDRVLLQCACCQATVHPDHKPSAQTCVCATSTMQTSCCHLPLLSTGVPDHEHHAGVEVQVAVAPNPQHGEWSQSFV
jgi:hypothetical protein